MRAGVEALFVANKIDAILAPTNSRPAQLIAEPRRGGGGPGGGNMDGCESSGQWIAFKTTKAERQAAGDPRKSLEERYRNHDARLTVLSRCRAAGAHGARELRIAADRRDQKQTDEFASRAAWNRLAAQQAAPSV